MLVLYILTTLLNVVQVETLLLLSQQEERYILESNVNLALQNKIEDLQKNLRQVILMVVFTAYTLTPFVISL